MNKSRSIRCIKSG